MSSDKVEFNSENLDEYLKELGKAIKKNAGKNADVELILIGGASILVNYSFRQKTFDFDVIVLPKSSAVEDAIRAVGNAKNLSKDWMNTDFVHTTSFTPNLRLVANYYKRFSGVLEVRTVSEEYLVAMKLMAGRKYRHDLSDVVGILKEHAENGNPLSMEKIKNAVIKLYGSWDKIPEHSKKFIEKAINSENYSVLLEQIKEQEENALKVASKFERDYPKVLNESNINQIIDGLLTRNGQVDIAEVAKSPLKLNISQEENTKTFFRKEVTSHQLEAIKKEKIQVQVAKSKEKEDVFCIQYDSSLSKEIEECLKSLEKKHEKALK